MFGVSQSCDVNRSCNGKGELKRTFTKR